MGTFDRDDGWVWVECDISIIMIELRGNEWSGFAGGGSHDCWLLDLDHILTNDNFVLQYIAQDIINGVWTQVTAELAFGSVVSRCHTLPAIIAQPSIRVYKRQRQSRSVNIMTMLMTIINICHCSTAKVR